MIDNAKQYVKEKLIERAKSIYANALLGLDYEASFGTEIVKVSMSGTAVRIKKIQTDAKKANSLDCYQIYSETGTESTEIENVIPEEARIEVKYTNTDELIPLYIARDDGNDNDASLALSFYSKTAGVQAILADIVVHTYFDESLTYQGISFVNINKQAKKCICKYTKTMIPADVLERTDYISLIVRKISTIDELKFVNEEQLNEITMIEIKDSQKSLKEFEKDDLYKCADEKENASELYNFLAEYLDATDPDKKAFLNRAAMFANIEKHSDDHASMKDRIMPLLKKFIDNNMTWHMDISHGTSQIKCCNCGASQQSDRECCYACGTQFVYNN